MAKGIMTTSDSRNGVVTRAHIDVTQPDTTVGEPK